LARRRFLAACTSSSRNLTGSNGRLRKDKRQTCKKAGIRVAEHSSEDTQQPPSPSEFITYSSKQGSRVTDLGRHDITSDGYSLDVNILGKASVLHFALPPSTAGGCAHPSLQIIGHSCAYVKFSWAFQTLLATRILIHSQCWDISGLPKPCPAEQPPAEPNQYSM
jgi:hypothetical protein